jgi:hypothetical protein
MIYEMRTYTVKPGMVPKWEEMFASAYNGGRDKYSPLFGLWHTELGPLNQVIHIWPYKDLQERADIRARSAKELAGAWPAPGSGDLLVSMETDILDPVANMQQWEGPQQLGEVYELRTYTYSPADMGKAAAAFNEAVAGRHAVYPVAGMFTVQQGSLNRLHQLFPYKSWAHREEVRSEFRKQGVWPPHAEVRPINQLVRFLIPAAVSPMH